MEPLLESQQPPAYGVHQKDTVETVEKLTEQPTLTSLAQKIQDLSRTLTDTLEKNNVPLCTFAVDGPATYATPSPETFMMRQTLIETLQDMIYLTQGPNESIFNYAHSVRLPLVNLFEVFGSLLISPDHPRRRMSQHPEPLRLLVRRAPLRLCLLP